MAERVELGPAEERARQVLIRIKDYRGLTDTEIALGAGMSRAAVSHRCTGRTKISLDDVEALARVLDVSPDVFRLQPWEAARWLADQEEAMASVVPIKSTFIRFRQVSTIAA
jgi:transcriptional regulator with XRE-family HTH domain